MKHEINPLNVINNSSGDNRSARVLEWMGLLPALGVCAWIILNYG
ncbi:hypothetical protein AAII07_52520 [Microvirga sp. 0TCS3.31]